MNFTFSETIGVGVCLLHLSCHTILCDCKAFLIRDIFSTGELLFILQIYSKVSMSKVLSVLAVSFYVRLTNQTTGQI